MMRIPIRANTSRRQVVGSPRGVPAPTLGLYAMENDTDLPRGSAKQLENWWPQPDTVSLRRGSLEHATGLPGRVETLMNWQSGSDQKLFAAAVAGIYDVTTRGPASARRRVVSNPRCAWTNFANSGGQWLVICNGADAPVKYDGTIFTAINISDGGPANQNTINTVWQYRTRLYFLSSEDPTTIYYLPADSVGGALSRYEVGGELSLGGKLAAGTRWTVDSGQGPDDKLVVVSDQGEVIVFNGRDPSADNWSKLGTYRIGKPVGSRCVVNIGGDLAILCDDGLVPLSTLVQVDRSQQARGTVTKNIVKLFNETIRERGRGNEWMVHLWASGSMLICNVPPVATGAEQFVMNTQHGAWAKFTGMDASCWGTLGDFSFYGTPDGRVMQFWRGSVDAGEPITALMVPAFGTLGYGGLKTVSLMRSNLVTSDELTVRIGIGVDYEVNDRDLVALDFDAPLSNWDEVDWDVADWADDDVIRRQAWQGVSGVGYAFAPILAVETPNLGETYEIDCRVINFDIVAANGGIL